MTVVHISCLCGQVGEDIRLKSEPPVRVTVCHCNSCRYTSGSLYNSYLPVEDKLQCIDRLKPYNPFPSIVRYFCPTCGCHVCQRSKGGWMVSSGVVHPTEHPSFDGLEDVVAHEFVQDTVDGGLAILISDAKDIYPHRFDSSSSDRLNFLSNQQPKTGQREEKLQASCHCGGIQFYLTAPNAESHRYSSPWPDLIIPYHSGSSLNPDDVKWWIRDNKWFAGTCACRSCRLGLGFPIQCFAFVSKCNIFHVDGSKFDFGSGTMRAYESSSGVFREFCGRCGATAFWHCMERPYVIDVNVGILRAPEGARAENWLDWCTDRVSFSEMAVDKQLINSLQLGLQKHDITRSSQE